MPQCLVAVQPRVQTGHDVGHPAVGLQDVRGQPAHQEIEHLGGLRRIARAALAHAGDEIDETRVGFLVRGGLGAVGQGLVPQRFFSAEVVDRVIG